MTERMHKIAVVFDMDGVLIDSEAAWDDVRRAFVTEEGGEYHDRAHLDMMGMSAPEWTRYTVDRLGVRRPPDEINAIVVERLAERYRTNLPLIPGAAEAVRTLAGSYALAVASSSNRVLIELVLEAAGLRERFSAVVSSEEVPRGKPSPDVYLRASELLGVAPARCIAVEDSGNGIRAAHAAGMTVIAYPNAEYPPAAGALQLAARRLVSMHALPEAVASLAAATASEIDVRV